MKISWLVGAFILFTSNTATPNIAANTINTQPILTTQLRQPPKKPTRKPYPGYETLLGRKYQFVYDYKNGMALYTYGFNAKQNSQLRSTVALLVNASKSPENNMFYCLRDDNNIRFTGADARDLRSFKAIFNGQYRNIYIHNIASTSSNLGNNTYIPVTRTGPRPKTVIGFNIDAHFNTGNASSDLQKAGGGLAFTAFRRISKSRAVVGKSLAGCIGTGYYKEYSSPVYLGPYSVYDYR